MTAKRHLRPVPEHGNRVVLYVRVSALMGRSGEEFHSPAMQAKAMRDLASRRGLREVAVVEDIDVSGRHFERDGIRRVLEMARNREIDVVALYDLSRLGRNTADSLRTIAELRDLGVSVVSTVEQIDDTPEGQFQLGVFLGMAQLYSDQISRRWRQVQERRAELGYLNGSIAPFGYRRGEHGALDVDPVVAAAVREVFRRYAAGERLWDIADRWRRESGRRSSYVTLKRMLANPVYFGQVHLNGRVFPGKHEPLVGEHLWRRVQRRLADDRRTPSRSLEFRNPVAGLVFCEQCKRPLQMHQRRKDDVPRLQCRGASDFRDCPGPGVPAVDQVCAALLDEIEREYNAVTVDVAARAVARRSEVARAAVDVGRLRRELAKVEAALSSATADLYRGVTTDAEHQGAVEILRGEAEALRVRLVEAERVKERPRPAEAVKLAAAVRSRWRSMTAVEKNRALKSLVRKASVRRAVSYREPVADRMTVVLW